MTTETQQLVVLAAVILAAAYVVWAAIARFRRRTAKACGGCTGCSATTGETNKSFVSLDQLSNPPRRS